MDSRIEKVLGFITNNMNEDISLNKLSSIAGLSKFHFQKLFTHEVGESPLSYINKKRIETAAHTLIMFPTMKQLEVAFELGYSSPAVFARSFKAYYGKTVKAFRKEKLEKTTSTCKGEVQQLNISYIRRQEVSVEMSNLTIDRITSMYKKLIIKNTNKVKGIGFFIDAPMHTKLEKVIYYTGLEDKEKSNSGLKYCIEEGYYCSIIIQGDFNQVSQQIVQFKENTIDASPYYIASLIGFEKIQLPKEASQFDYFKIPRTLYLKIKRR